MCPLITSATNITIRFPCGTTHSFSFYITQLDSKFPTVLGLDWLTQHNWLIDWVDQSVTFCVRPDSTLISAPAMASVVSKGAPCNPKTPSVSASAGPINISLVCATAFVKAARAEGSQTSSLSLNDTETFGRSTTTLSMSSNTSPNSNPDIKDVLKSYHEYADVFSKSNAKKLAPHRDYDLKIELEEGAKPPFGLIYPLSEAELTAL